jgi:hypothetical protein
MQLNLTRNPARRGCSDEWRATMPGRRPGIGRNRTEAIGSLVGANLAAFGISARLDEDCDSPGERAVLWRDPARFCPFSVWFPGR